MEKWTILSKKADFYGIGKELNISPYLVRLMVNRDVRDVSDMKRYLNGTPESLLSPYSMKDIVKGAKIARECMDAGEKIIVSSDFDVDGIFSGLILKKGISFLGGNVDIKTPDRVLEGYGINDRIVDEAASEGVSLIITCDNGIVAFDPIRKAVEMGIKVIVTDHHEPLPGRESENLADAIIDPKQADCVYPFKGLCGAGVAYKFLRVLFDMFIEEGRVNREEAEQYYYSLMEYVAIATVADVMELVEENRIIVKYGLKLLRNSENTGLNALIDLCNISKESIGVYHIGFIIGPCFNAAGRLSTVKDALALLETEDREEAYLKAAVLKELNDTRKEMTVKGLEKALEIIERDRICDDKVILVQLEDCHESLVGIIAGRIKEVYNRPVICFTTLENGVIKGSGRSIEEYNMHAHLSMHESMYMRFGGHAMAAGITMEASKFADLRKVLNEEAELTEDDLCKKVSIDIALPIQYATESLIDELEMLEPFGNGNRKPLFAESHFSITGGRVLGKNKNVLRMNVTNKDGYTKTGIYFGDIDRFNEFIIEKFGAEQLDAFYNDRRNNIDIALSYYPDINEYMGRRSIQIVIQNYCTI